MYPEDKQKEVPYPMSRKNPFVMPILKWVGGKRQLLDSINPLIPECSTYYEPFIGGRCGALWETAEQGGDQ